MIMMMIWKMRHFKPAQNTFSTRQILLMKHLLLLFLFSGSLDGFSQGKDTTKQWNIFGDLNLQEPARFEIDKNGRMFIPGQTGAVFDPSTIHYSNDDCKCRRCTPDTLRAICLVTLFPNGIAHARMGFVVIAGGKEVKYLDCRKKALKLPQVGWGYRLIDPNYKQN